MAKRKKHSGRQHGGTFLGIVIGLVIGLGIALGVAVMINKTPVPFMNKVAKQGANAPTAGQLSDPNKPLYGNRAAAKEAAKAQAVEKPAADLAKSADRQPAVTAQGKPEVVELSSVDKSRNVELVSTSVRPAERADDKWTYYLQAGAFRESIDAENTRARLALMGVEARVTERQAENGVLYRVRIGPFAQLDTLNRVRGKLTDNGVEAAVVRVAKN